MSARAVHLVIDARPRGPRGLLAAEVVLGRSVLGHLLDLAVEHVPRQSRSSCTRARMSMNGSASWPSALARMPSCSSNGPPRADAAVLRTDRLYDPARLRRGLRRGPIAGIRRALAARPAGVVVDRR